MRFEIRRAVPGDEAVLRALRIEALTDSPEAFGSTPERELARTPEDWRKWISPGVTFLVETNGVAAGLVAGARDPDDETTVHLRAMWIRSSLRGSGAADALVASVKAWAAEVGAKRLLLIVVEDNVAAKRCYEHAGFRHTGNRGIHEKTGGMEIEMACEIDQA